MVKLSYLLNLSPRDFEEHVARLLPKLGYRNVKLTSHSSDSGYDISAVKDKKIVLFECKRYSPEKKVGAREVRIFADACRRKNADKGIFITTGNFTRTVVSEQKERQISIEFWDGKHLIQEINNAEKGNIKALLIFIREEMVAGLYILLVFYFFQLFFVYLQTYENTSDVLTTFISLLEIGNSDAHFLLYSFLVFTIYGIFSLIRNKKHVYFYLLLMILLIIFSVFVLYQYIFSSFNANF